MLGLSLREALALGVRPPLAALRVRCLGIAFSSAPSPVVALSLREALPLGVRRLSSALIVRGLSGKRRVHFRQKIACAHCGRRWAWRRPQAPPPRYARRPWAGLLFVSSAAASFSRYALAPQLRGRSGLLPGRRPSLARGGPPFPASLPPLATLAPAKGLAGFGRAVAACGGRFSRLPPMSQ